MQLWFVAELGANRGGQVGVRGPRSILHLLLEYTGHVARVQGLGQVESGARDNLDRFMAIETGGLESSIRD